MNPNEEPPRERLDPFDTAWKMCEEKGRCDACGGAEYRRLRDRWDAIVGVAFALDYIVTAANAPPPRPTGKDGAQ